MRAGDGLANVVRWRWMPFVALVAASSFFVLLAILIVPDNIGGTPPGLRAPVENSDLDTQTAVAPRATRRGAAPPSQGGGTPSPLTASSPPPGGPQLIEWLCAASVKCNNAGAPSVAECRQTNMRERAAAVAKDCGPQFDALLSCVATQATACSQNSLEVCASQKSELEKCRSSPDTP